MSTRTGRVALVTGASRGIGAAVAARMQRDGFDVAIARRSAAPQLPDALCMQCDLREPAAAQTVVDGVLARFGRLDVLVNNAGATKRGSFLSLHDDDFVDGFALKYFAAVRLSRAAWPSLVRSSGAIVNVVGVGGKQPGADFAIGGSVNAALLALTKALADQGVVDGVTVNAVNPGPVLTDRLFSRLRILMESEGIDEETARERFTTSFGVKRLGTPEDIANLVAFLVSPDATFLHGALIDIDGGMHKAV